MEQIKEINKNISCLDSIKKVCSNTSQQTHTEIPWNPEVQKCTKSIHKLSLTFLDNKIFQNNFIGEHILTSTSGNCFKK